MLLTRLYVQSRKAVVKREVQHSTSLDRNEMISSSFQQVQLFATTRGQRHLTDAICRQFVEWSEDLMDNAGLQAAVTVTLQPCGPIAARVC